MQLALNVGAVAKKTGVGVQTLHYYERIDLLPKPARSEANYRLYSSDIANAFHRVPPPYGRGLARDQLRRYRGAVARSLESWREKTAHRRNCAGEFCDLIERLPEA